MPFLRPCVSVYVLVSQLKLAYHNYDFDTNAVAVSTGFHRMVSTDPFFALQRAWKAKWHNGAKAKMENENFATKDVHVIVACSLPAVHNHNNNNHSTKRVYKGVDCSVILAHCACEMANLPCNFELFNGSRHLEQQNSVSNNNKSSIIGPLF